MVDNRLIGTTLMFAMTIVLIVVIVGFCVHTFWMTRSSLLRMIIAMDTDGAKILSNSEIKSRVHPVKGSHRRNPSAHAALSVGHTLVQVGRSARSMTSDSKQHGKYGGRSNSRISITEGSLAKFKSPSALNVSLATESNITAKTDSVSSIAHANQRLGDAKKKGRIPSDATPISRSLAPREHQQVNLQKGLEPVVDGSQPKADADLSFPKSNNHRQMLRSHKGKGSHKRAESVDILLSARRGRQRSEASNNSRTRSRSQSRTRIQRRERKRQKIQEIIRNLNALLTAFPLAGSLIIATQMIMLVWAATSSSQRASEATDNLIDHYSGTADAAITCSVVASLLFHYYALAEGVFDKFVKCLYCPKLGAVDLLKKSVPECPGATDSRNSSNTKNSKGMTPQKSSSQPGSDPNIAIASLKNRNSLNENGEPSVFSIRNISPRALEMKKKRTSQEMFTGPKFGSQRSNNSLPEPNKIMQL